MRSIEAYLAMNVLGEGSFGRVFLAMKRISEHNGTRCSTYAKMVAIKCLKLRDDLQEV